MTSLAALFVVLVGIQALLAVKLADVLTDGADLRGDPMSSQRPKLA